LSANQNKNALKREKKIKEDRNRVAASSYHITRGNSEMGKSRSESDAPLMSLLPRVLDVTIGNRNSVSVNNG
jgi:hypothetical protein